MESPQIDLPRHLLGTPVLVGVPYKGGSGALVPLGQEALARSILGRVRSRSVLADRLRREYRALVDALLRAEIDFRILNLDDGEPRMVRWLRKRGCGSLRFVGREANRWQMFPRDLFVWIEAASVLLVHGRLFRLSRGAARGAEILHSSWGEGGRVLSAGDRMLLPRHPEAKRTPRARCLDRLRERGVRIGSIPQPISCRLDRRSGRVQELFFEPHLDRVATLLKGPDGGFVLLLDPGFRTGPLTAPLSVGDSIDRVRRVAGRLEIEVKVPRALVVPYATGVCQVGDGRVVVTAGDPEVAAACAEVVGRTKVLTLAEPFYAYPIFAAAGLHCLLTEMPAPLVRRTEERSALSG